MIDVYSITYTCTDCTWWPSFHSAAQRQGPVIHFPPSRAPKRVGPVRERHPERKVWKPP